MSAAGHQQFSSRHTVTSKQDQSLTQELDLSQIADVTDQPTVLTTRESSDVTSVTDRDWKVPESWREEFEERSAILEFEGGLSRNEAEQAAYTLLSMSDRSDCEPTKSNGNQRNE